LSEWIPIRRSTPYFATLFAMASRAFGIDTGGLWLSHFHYLGTSIGFMRSPNVVIPGTNTASTMKMVTPSRSRPTPIRSPEP
jgi:hypothetical protein